MREIKFRGKNYLRPSTWVYGNLVTYGNKPSIQDYSVTNGEIFQVDPATVGQYTGLKDKNGKEIYKGDLVKSGYFHRIEKVEFVNCAFVVKSNTKSGYTLLSWWCNKGTGVEIIGNIYENPEIMEDSANE